MRSATPIRRACASCGRRRPTCAPPGRRSCAAPALGALLGILPGGGAVLASFASYTLEKKLAKDPSRFGNGAIEGVAGPESANNAGAQTSFIPLLTLGLPSNAVMALMMGAMIIQGIAPGSAVMDKAARPVLGHGRLHVDRQRHAAGHQPAAARRVGEAPVGAVPAAVSGGPAVLRDRRLQHQHRSRAARAHRAVRGVRLSCWCGSAASRRRWCSASFSGR